MFKTKKILCIFLGMIFCSGLLGGCSEDQGKKQEKKGETSQERLGKETARNLQKPLEDAHQAAQLGTERVKALDEAGREPKPASQEVSASPPPAGGKEKKKLEGC